MGEILMKWSSNSDWLMLNANFTNISAISWLSDIVLYYQCSYQSTNSIFYSPNNRYEISISQMTMCRYRMVVGFTTTYAISAYHHIPQQTLLYKHRSSNLDRYLINLVMQFFFFFLVLNKFTYFSSSICFVIFSEGKTFFPLLSRLVVTII